jgi:hypothetical protein
MVGPQVLAWTANIIGAAVLAGGTIFIVAIWDELSRSGVEAILQAAVPGALIILVTVIWGIGRALRYVLTGPPPQNAVEDLAEAVVGGGRGSSALGTWGQAGGTAGCAEGQAPPQGYLAGAPAAEDGAHVQPDARQRAGCREAQ